MAQIVRVQAERGCIEWIWCQLLRFICRHLSYFWNYSFQYQRDSLGREVNLILRCGNIWKRMSLLIWSIHLVLERSLGRFPSIFVCSIFLGILSYVIRITGLNYINLLFTVIFYFIQLFEWNHGETWNLR